MNIEKLYGRDVADRVDERMTSSCPTPLRWWLVRLGKAAWTPEEATHIATCNRCEQTKQRIEQESALVGDVVSKASEDRVGTTDPSSPPVLAALPAERAKIAAAATETTFVSRAEGDTYSRRRFVRKVAGLAAGVSGVIFGGVGVASGVALAQQELKEKNRELRDSQREYGRAQQQIRALKSLSAQLNAEIELSQVRNAYRVDDFSASGRNTIAVRGSYDRRFVQGVAWKVREGEIGTLEEKRVIGRDGAVRIEFNGRAKVELGSGRFTSELMFEPLPDAREKLKEFFSPENLAPKRLFLATLDGVITDPPSKEETVAARLDYIVFKEEPNFYKVVGRISRDLLGKYGWIVGLEDTSETYYVLGGIFVDDQRDPPTFHATCRLGDPGDDFQLFAAFSDDVNALHAGGTIPLVSEFKWDRFTRSESRPKKHDEKDDFTEQEKSPN